MFKPRIKRWNGIWICWACGIATKGATAKVAWTEWAKQVKQRERWKSNKVDGIV